MQVSTLVLILEASVSHLCLAYDLYLGAVLID